MPLDYGMTTQSYIFMNDGKGHFTDVAKSTSNAIANAGMITSAAWADVAGDARKELVLTGEWMAPHVFTWNNNKFTELKSNPCVYIHCLHFHSTLFARQKRLELTASRHL